MWSIQNEEITNGFFITRKYPLCGYFLYVLMHTTAWDRHWEGDETLKRVLINIDRLCLANLSFSLPHGPRGVRVTQIAYFSVWTHTKKLLLVRFCDQTAKTGVTFRTDRGQTDGGQTDGGQTDGQGRRTDGRGS